MKVNELQLLRSCCRSSFKFFLKEFVRVTIPGVFRWNWHIDILCDVLQEAAERIFLGLPSPYDIAINISPGTTKSTIMSTHFPMWCWTRMPEFRFIGVSYNEKLALDLSRRSRDIALDAKYQACFPEIKLREDQSTKSYFCNTLGGNRYCAGAGGGVLGHHAHFIAFDDPIDPVMASSDLEVENINYWIKNTVWGRVVDKAVSVRGLVMQRLRQNDPTQLFTGGDSPTRWIRIPATTEFPINPPELSKFYVNGLMDPKAMSWDWINKQRSKIGIGNAAFSSQYGQDPVPLGGGMFKTDKLGTGKPPAEWKSVCRGWDKAVTPQKGSLLKGAAFTVGVLLGVDLDNNVWILDVIRDRLDSYSRENLIEQTAIRDGKHCFVAIEQEPGSGGKDSALATARRLLGYRVKLLPASGSKEARADAFSHAVNAGIVFIPEKFKTGTSWIDWAGPFVEEMMHWPQSTFLDQIDAAASAFTVAAAGKIRVGALLSTVPGNPPNASQIDAPLIVRAKSGTVIDLGSRNYRA